MSLRCSLLTDEVEERAVRRSQAGHVVPARTGELRRRSGIIVERAQKIARAVGEPARQAKANVSGINRNSRSPSEQLIEFLASRVVVLNLIDGFIGFVSS